MSRADETPYLPVEDSPLNYAQLLIDDWMQNYLGEPMTVRVQTSTALAVKYQGLADKIWADIIAACDAYFYRGEKYFPGNEDAPEFTDEQVEEQVASWDEYRQDSGAMNWRTNTTKEFAYDLTKLPHEFKRALCERAYMYSKEAGLWNDDEWMERVYRRRGDG